MPKMICPKAGECGATADYCEHAVEHDSVFLCGAETCGLNKAVGVCVPVEKVEE